MAASTQPAGWSFPQTFLTVAALRAPRSLRTRLMVVVAVSVALVIGIEGYFELLLMERATKEDLFEMARATAQAVADDMERRSAPLLGQELEESLHKFVEAYPAIRAIAIVRVVGGTPAIEASTLSSERPEVLTTGRMALERREVVRSAEGTPLWMVAAPVLRHEQRDAAAVVVGVSFASLERLRVRASVATLLFAPAAMLILTLVIGLLTRRLVHRPIDAIIETIQRVGGGNLRARAQVERPDELGAIAAGLNVMLYELEQFSVGLQARVDETTGELRKRNRELVASYQRMFTLRETLARAEQMALVGQMAASAAHQIGTPLNLISGHVQLMTQQCTDPKTLTRLRAIEAQVAKVTTTVRTMLDTARRPVTSPQVVDLAPLVRHLGDTARPVLEAAGIQVSMDIREPVPPVRLDPAQFELVLFNLVSNSIDAMPGGGTIRVTLEALGNGVRVEVTDTGTGIAPELLPHIFDTWVTSKPRGKGTGLGLSIVRDIVQAHGGTITVDSAQGRGSTFTIELPVAATLVAAADAVEADSFAAAAEDSKSGQ